jgi:hypothetical protein
MVLSGQTSNTIGPHPSRSTLERFQAPGVGDVAYVTINLEHLHAREACIGAGHGRCARMDGWMRGSHAGFFKLP